MRLQIFIIVMLVCATTVAFAASQPDVGSVVSLRGSGTILQDGKSLAAKVKSGIQLGDVVQTAPSSRMKLLFSDDSVLTLGDSSSVVIKEFLYSKADRGKSVFNLLDGKMRAAVGKTKFEVLTPSVVAAARGTVIFFETGIKDGINITSITCLEGVVDIRGVANLDGPATALLAGMTVVTAQGSSVPLPTPTSPKELERIKKEMASASTPVPLLQPTMPGTFGSGVLSVDIPQVKPPVPNQQPPHTVPTGVKVGVKFH